MQNPNKNGDIFPTTGSIGLSETKIQLLNNKWVIYRGVLKIEEIKIREFTDLSNPLECQIAFHPKFGETIFQIWKKRDPRRRPDGRVMWGPCRIEKPGACWRSTPLEYIAAITMIKVIKKIKGDLENLSSALDDFNSLPDVEEKYIWDKIKKCKEINESYYDMDVTVSNNEEKFHRGDEFEIIFNDTGGHSTSGCSTCSATTTGWSIIKDSKKINFLLVSEVLEGQKIDLTEYNLISNPKFGEKLLYVWKNSDKTIRQVGQNLGKLLSEELLNADPKFISHLIDLENVSAAEKLQILKLEYLIDNKKLNSKMIDIIDIDVPPNVRKLWNEIDREIRKLSGDRIFKAVDDMSTKPGNQIEGVYTGCDWSQVDGYGSSMNARYHLLKEELPFDMKNYCRAPDERPGEITTLAASLKIQNYNRTPRFHAIKEDKDEITESMSKQKFNKFMAFDRIRPDLMLVADSIENKNDLFASFSSDLTSAACQALVEQIPNQIYPLLISYFEGYLNISEQETFMNFLKSDLGKALFLMIIGYGGTLTLDNQELGTTFAQILKECRIQGLSLPMKNLLQELKKKLFPQMYRIVAELPEESLEIDEEECLEEKNIDEMHAVT